MDKSLWVGMRAEDRFFEVMQEARDRPEWLKKIHRACPRYNIHGIDGIAYIRTQSGRIVKVPIQIKSSEKGVQAFFKKYKRYWELRIVTIVVRDKMSDRMLREHCYSEFRRIHRLDYEFKELFNEFRGKPLNRSGLRMKKTILEMSLQSKRFTEKRIHRKGEHLA